MGKNNFRISAAQDKTEINNAFHLAEEVFMQFEAPVFTQRGIDSFRDFLWGKRVREMLRDGSMKVWCCYSGNELIGMLSLRDGEHISLAFVKGDHHRQGAGRMLFAEAKKYALAMGRQYITVNASDHGIPFYRAMGFRETDMQLDTDGIIYTPMEAKI